MQRIKILPPFLLLFVVILAGCADKTVKIYQANVPIYTPTDTWRNQNFTFEASHKLTTPGKIYLYDNLLLVNEFLQGVHFYDNTNPASPIELGFLPVIANQDLAVRNNILYVDSYTDLLSFDISDPRNPHYLSRVPDVFTFENYVFLAGYDMNYPMVEIDPNQGIVTGWKLEETTQEVVYYRAMPMFDVLSSSSPMGAGAESSSNFATGVGLAGSTARFAIVDHYLYTLELWEIGVFDIQEGMVLRTNVPVTGDAETLFPAEGNLYVGTMSGMLIYSLADPGNPSMLSMYSHMTMCDPVVVQGDKAFLTLHSGTRCGGSFNTLEVIDLTDIYNPTLLYSFNMSSPRGLGVDGNTLFMCDHVDGLKVFDKTDLSTIDQHMIAQFSNITAADVIPNNNVLLMTSDEGIYQYDYTDPQHIAQLSLIPVQH